MLSFVGPFSQKAPRNAVFVHFNFLRRAAGHDPAARIPAAGALLKGEDNGEKQLTLEV